VSSFTKAIWGGPSRGTSINFWGGPARIIFV